MVTGESYDFSRDLYLFGTMIIILALKVIFVIGKSFLPEVVSNAVVLLKVGFSGNVLLT